MNRYQISIFSALLGAATLSATAHHLQAQTRPSKLTGTVAGQPMGREFIMRANGETYRVRPLGKVSMTGIRGGDRVRVWGRPTGLVVSFANVRVLSSGASSSPTDYNPAPGTTSTTTTGAPVTSTAR
jgi:hypothetical protein